jgi:hypothetical protein
MAFGNIVIPKNISFTDWVCRLKGNNPAMTIPLPPNNENEWEIWVKQLIYANPTLDIPLPPDKKEKNSTDWVTWAEHFINIVYN